MWIYEIHDVFLVTRVSFDTICEPLGHMRTGNTSIHMWYGWKGLDVRLTQPERPHTTKGYKIVSNLVWCLQPWKTFRYTIWKEMYCCSQRLNSCRNDVCRRLSTHSDARRSKMAQHVLVKNLWFPADSNGLYRKKHFFEMIRDGTKKHIN